MKRYLISMFMAIAAFAAMAAMAAGKAGITFDSSSHDFGTIQSSNGVVTAEYKFTNTGDAPLIIVDVTNGGCGCTTPSFPKEPIAPGKSGVIAIHFDPTGRRGEFNREVKVRTNVDKKRRSLRFNGVIVP